MRLTRRALPTLIGLALAAAASAAGAQSVLTAVKVAAPPKVDATASDATWQKAKPVTVDLFGGSNFKDGKGSTKVTLKAVYAGDMLYMLAQWDDPTQSVRRSPYVKQADGTWLKVKDPNDKGGDNNIAYEDKFAFIWNIGGSIKGFDEKGCMATCHMGEGKPYGNKYTAAEGEMGDIWHMKFVRTGATGQIDDQYLDHTPYDKEKAPGAGRKSDPKTGGGYQDVKLVDGKPEFMSKSGKAAGKGGGTYWLPEGDKVAFADKFKTGDELASIMVAPFTGDRGDLASGMKHAGGKWTLELSRKLVTGGKFDVQFDKLDAAYPFGVAAFDNAQVRHAVHSGPVTLKFAQ